MKPHHVLAGAVLLFAAACAESPTDPAATQVDGALAIQSAVEVCHLDGDTGTWVLLSISDNGSAVERHVAHGDGFPDGDVPGMEGFAFDAACVPTEVVTETVFAIAYIDQDPGDGEAFVDGVDVLVAKLVDTSGDGVPSAGDEVVTDAYPVDLDATGAGAFTVTRHTVDAVFVQYFAVGGASVTQVRADISGTPFATFLWLGGLPGAAKAVEAYFEQNAAAFTQVADWVGDLDPDRLDVAPSSPSAPDVVDPIDADLSRATDDPFIDVEFRLPPPA